MPYAAYLNLDITGAERFDRLVDRIESIGDDITTPRGLGHGHHLTLGVYDALDVAGMIGALEDFTHTIDARTIAFPGLGSFPGERSVLFAAPLVTADLLDLHARYHHATARQGHGQPYYHPGAWVPHVTLAVDLAPDQLARGVAAVAGDWTPLTCRLDRIELVEFLPVETLWSGALVQN